VHIIKHQDHDFGNFNVIHVDMTCVRILSYRFDLDIAWFACRNSSNTPLPMEPLDEFPTEDITVNIHVQIRTSDGTNRSIFDMLQVLVRFNQCTREYFIREQLNNFIFFCRLINALYKYTIFKFKVL
jgi:hypothetical protein